MPSASNMKGRAALVTGAASGVGRSAALALARAGADLFLVDRTEAELEEAARLAEGAGARACAYVTDLSLPDNCRAAVAAAVGAFGRLDALCNVAGVFFPDHTETMPEDAFELTLAVNLRAPFYLIQAAIPHLLEARGAVVNVTSCAGITAQAYAAAYGASKAGLNHMTRALAMEFMHKPIRFNAVAPGGMLTTMTKTAQMPEGMDMDLFRRISPLRGLVDVEAVAEMVAFLASDAAEAYHGACITIDKGITAG